TKKSFQVYKSKQARFVNLACSNPLYSSPATRMMTIWWWWSGWRRYFIHRLILFPGSSSVLDCSLWASTKNLLGAFSCINIRAVHKMHVAEIDCVGERNTNCQ